MINQEKPSLKPFSMAKKAYEKEEEEEDHERDEDWLQLSTGGKTTNSCFSVQSLCSLRSKNYPTMHGLKLSEQVAWRVWNSTTTCSISTSSSFMQYDHQGFPVNMMKVVTPPQRPPAGVWFILKAEKNHGRQLSLPQINKSYLRIKDSSMRIRLLLKYLASKLGLGHESEVEITCRGQGLHPYFTLKHVRDNIWCQRGVISTPTKDHLMTLKYHRRI